VKQTLISQAGQKIENAYCAIGMLEFSGLVLIPGEEGVVWYTPQQLAEHKFKPDISLTRELTWIDRRKNESVPATMLADKIVRIFLDLISRVNQGKVPNRSGL
jgi:hypothetical protein